MDSIIVQGNGPVSGEIPISGAKNAALTLMPAALLTDKPVTFTNVPRLSDIKTTNELLASLGTKISMIDDGQKITLTTPEITNHLAHYDIVRKMRASILVLGPIVARHGIAAVSLPGGCAIGARPVDIHLKGLEVLGVDLDLRDGYIHAKAPNGLIGATYELTFASVGATENLLMAATLAKGTTVLKNVAREPEIIDLADLLRLMGANIIGDGSSVIKIEGVETLHGATHQVVTDRIELGTYMMAPLIAGGQVELLGGKRRILESFCQKLEEAGAEITETERGLLVARNNADIRAVSVTTEPYPGFPTDLQAQMMALLCTAEGKSVLNETIFENRFMHAPELIRMGANIEVHGGTATVTGVNELRGAPVMATDLRASVSLILAGLAAKGETRVARVYHLDRGYEKVVSKFRAIGANIERIKE
jgi:UDP-N-acetylglucosamine 1-carboxyvinyltransferase